MPLQTISPATLKQWLDKQEAVLIDVREPAEHHSARLEQSTLIPLGKIDHTSLPVAKDRKLVIHCQKGARGRSACEKLLREYPELEVYNLEGGLEAWQAAGYEVASSGSKILPLDRQVQLTIGLLLLTFSLLGYLLSPTWFAATALIGAGLTLAGATGFCGLALLIARMPWNQKGTPQSAG